MRPDPKPDSGTTSPRGDRANEIPRQQNGRLSAEGVSVPGPAGAVPAKEDRPVLGQDNEELLPPESRAQWVQTLNLRRTGLLTIRRYLPVRNGWGVTHEDVWQTTKAAVWARLKNKGPVDDIKSYVLSACRNNALAELRKYKDRAELFIGDDAELLRVDGPVFNVRTDARITEWLSYFRPELTEKEALVIILRVCVQLRTSEVAMVLDMTEDAVNSSFRNSKRKCNRPKIRDRLIRRLHPE